MRGHKIFKRFAGLIAVFMVVAGITAVSTFAVASQAPNPPQSGALHLTKECSEYAGGIGSYCTFTSSNVAAIPVGTRIFYAQAPGPDTLDSDVILYAGRGNTATGHCTVDRASGSGLCRLFGGTGTLDGFHARVVVSYLGGPNFAWDGRYRFRDD
jgi:hypothetical protein